MVSTEYQGALGGKSYECGGVEMCQERAVGGAEESMAVPAIKGPETVQALFSGVADGVVQEKGTPDDVVCFRSRCIDRNKRSKQGGGFGLRAASEC